MKKNVLALSIAELTGGLGLAEQSAPTAIRVYDGEVGDHILVPYWPQSKTVHRLTSSVMHEIVVGRVHFRNHPGQSEIRGLKGMP